MRRNQIWISVTALVLGVLFSCSHAPAEVSIVHLQEGQQDRRSFSDTTSIVDVKVLQEGIAEASASNAPDGTWTLHLLCRGRGIALVQYTRVDRHNKPNIELVALICGGGVTVLRHNIVATVGSTIGMPDEVHPTIWSSESLKAIEVERVDSGAYAAVARREGTAVVLHAIGPDVFTLDVVRVDKSRESTSLGRDGNGKDGAVEADGGAGDD